MILTDDKNLLKRKKEFKLFVDRYFKSFNEINKNSKQTLFELGLLFDAIKDELNKTPLYEDEV